MSLYSVFLKDATLVHVGKQLLLYYDTVVAILSFIGYRTCAQNNKTVMFVQGCSLYNAIALPLST